MSDNKKNKFNLYDLLNRNKNEIDAVSEAHEKKGINFFFKLLGRKLSNLLQINLLIVFGNFPILFLLLGLSQNFSAVTTTPQNILYAPLYGAMQFDKSPALMPLFGTLGNQVQINVPTKVTYIMYALGLLVIFTFGIVNAGTAYLLRNIVRGEPLFIMHDFFSTIKKNFRQAMIIGILDAAMLFLWSFDIYFFATSRGGLFVSMSFFLSIIFTILYLFMRMYMYVLLVTFNLKITKILKNSLIFALLGIKRNVVAFIGILIVVFLNIMLTTIFMPLGLIMPLIITLSLIWFICIYASYPKIKEIMIDPYYYEDGTPKEVKGTEEAVEE